MLQEKVMASKSFFNAKELEKMAAGVGIGGMVFKKELQMMIDEDMIVCDKVGAGNYYWKLPGDAANALNKKTKDAEANHRMLSTRLEELTKQVAEKKAASKDESGREKLLKRVSELEAETAGKRKEVDAFRDSDPEALKRMVDASTIGYEAAVRWTDNVWCLEVRPSVRADPRLPPSGDARR